MKLTSLVVLLGVTQLVLFEHLESPSGAQWNRTTRQRPLLYRQLEHHALFAPQKRLKATEGFPWVTFFYALSC